MDGDARVQVRIVYFPSSLTHSTTEYQTKLGVETYYAAPLLQPAFIKLTGAPFTPTQTVWLVAVI